MELINDIVEVSGIKHDYCMMEGFKITTSKQEILVLISEGQSCCEDFGYMSSFEHPDEFIGAELLKIETVDEAHNKEKWNTEHEFGLDEGDAEFVNFETSNGLFQLAVYNAHNGYYGHSILIKSNQLNIDSGL